ncbi:MAG: hypothetical protein ACREQZ_08715, partial [Woeseiaceae bacterium]
MRDLGFNELQLVYGGGEEPPPPPEEEKKEKGNNGWGNGADPTNPGSFSGGTAPSKSCNCSEGSDQINTNPT